MDILRLKQLAGIPNNLNDLAYNYLNEVVNLPDDIQLDDLVERLDACSRALKLVNKLPNPQDKKKWTSAVFVNLNKIRAAVQKYLQTLEIEPQDRDQFIDRIRNTAKQ